MDLVLQFKKIYMNIIPVVEDLPTPNILQMDADIVDWKKKKKNLLDEACRNKKIMSTTEIQLTFLLCEQPYCRLWRFSLSQMWHFLQQAIQFRDTFNWMYWNPQKWVSQERISTPRNSPWQAGRFWDQVHKSTETLQKIAVFDFESICVRGKQHQKYNDSNLVEKKCPKFNIPSFKPCGIIVSTQKLWSSLPKQVRMRNCFPDIETTIKNIMASIMRKLTECLNRLEQVKRFEKNEDGCENKNCASSQFLQKKRFISVFCSSIWSDKAM